MTKVTPPINNFNAGEISPLVDARVDLTKYVSGCRTMENCFPLVEGGAKKMPGTYYVAPPGNVSGKSRLAPFSFSTDQSYVLEFSDKLVRVFTPEGLLTGFTVPEGAVAYNPVTAYSAGRTVTVGDYWVFNFLEGKSLYISAPYGTPIPDLPIRISLVYMHGDTLQIEPYWNDGGITIDLAYDTPSKNAADLIQAGIRALGTVKGYDLSGIVVTPNAAYYAEPPSAHSEYSAAQNAIGHQDTYIARQVSQYCYFPPIEEDYWAAVGSIAGSVVEDPVAPTAATTYDPDTAYAEDDTVNVGGYWDFSCADGKSLYIAGVPGIYYDGYFVAKLDFMILIFPGHADELEIVVSDDDDPGNVTANVTIYLASETASKNSAANIQAAIRALGTVGTTDVSNFTVTPNAAYYAAPPAGTNEIPFLNRHITHQGSFQAVQANQYCYFPPAETDYWSSTLIDPGSGGGGGGGEVSTEAVTLVTPYDEDDIFDLDVETQSADMLFVFHHSYPPMVIARHAAHYWTISVLEFDGTSDIARPGFGGIAQPIDDIELNVSYVKLFVSKHGFADGDTVYINHCVGAFRLNKNRYTVTEVIDENSFYINENNAANWPAYEGGGTVVKIVPKFDEEGEYPGCGTFYEQRLVLGGFLNHPERLVGSVVSDFYNFTMDPLDDSSAFQFDLVSQKVDPILWMRSQNKLALGTVGGIWIVSGANGLPLSQTSVDAKRQITVGASNISPQIINDSLVWFDRVKRVGRLLQYAWNSDQWLSPDLTRIARHITTGATAALSGVKQTAYQQSPYPILWAVRNDGQLLGLTFESQEQVYAWFRIVTDGKFESIAVIPRENDEDQVWVVVDRS